MFSRSWQLPKVDPRSVQPSRHVIFIRGFPPTTAVERVKQFFASESSANCQIEFFSISDDRRNLFIALRFDSHTSAKEMIEKFDGQVVLEHCIHVCWFKDLRKARDQRYCLGEYGNGYANKSRYSSSGGVRRGAYVKRGGVTNSKWPLQGRYYGSDSHSRPSHYSSSHRSQNDRKDVDRSSKRKKLRSCSRSVSRSRSRSHKSRSSNIPPKAYRSISRSSKNSRESSKSFDDRHSSSRSPSRSSSSSAEIDDKNPLNKKNQEKKHHFIASCDDGEEEEQNDNHEDEKKNNHNLVGYKSVLSPKDNDKDSLNGGDSCCLSEMINNCNVAVDVIVGSGGGVVGNKPKQITASKSAQEKIRRKKLKIEKTFKKDCETFSTVSKIFISTDQELEQRLIPCLKEVIRQMGQQCIAELRLYINEVMTKEENLA